MTAAPLRIVHIVRAPIGGIFRHISDLAIAQTRAGHQVGVICDASTGGPFEDAAIAPASPPNCPSASPASRCAARLRPATSRRR